MIASPDIQPSVTIIIPVLNEERHLFDCLTAVASQGYPVLEILLVDGGSRDRTVEIAAGFPAVRILHNPARVQAAALNIGLRAAHGDLIVRVDGHCTIAPDYVEKCVQLLRRDDVAMVGGAMTPIGTGWKQQGIAQAMTSPFGAGPARFHGHGGPGRTDTVYLGAYRRVQALALGGYEAEFVANEDAEFAHRMGKVGAIWFDPSVRSWYEPRSTFRKLGKQFFRYGLGRAATVRRHPESLAPRQLAAPVLVVGLMTPTRRSVATAYLGMIAALSLSKLPRGVAPAVAFGIALPVMHISWGTGFLLGIIGVRSSARSGDATSTRSAQRFEIL